MGLAKLLMTNSLEVTNDEIELELYKIYQISLMNPIRAKFEINLISNAFAYYFFMNHGFGIDFYDKGNIISNKKNNSESSIRNKKNNLIYLDPIKIDKIANIGMDILSHEADRDIFGVYGLEMGPIQKFFRKTKNYYPRELEN